MNSQLIKSPVVIIKRKNRIEWMVNTNLCQNPYLASEFPCTTSFKICDLEIALEVTWVLVYLPVYLNIVTLPSFVMYAISNKSHTNQNVIMQYLLITTICVSKISSVMEAHGQLN